ncbi:hypothetical protein SUDANB178_07684 (plasmid) [Streptomyces sp. enrichment culture]
MAEFPQKENTLLGGKDRLLEPACPAGKTAALLRAWPTTT